MKSDGISRTNHSLADIFCVQWTGDCLGDANDISVEYTGVFDEPVGLLQKLCLDHIAKTTYSG
jgi:hypothetical protein